MQQRLALAGTAPEVTRLAGASYLRDVPAHRLPAADLALIRSRQPPAAPVAAIPLEPAARIVGMDPALGAPHRQLLAGVDAEEVQRGIASSRRKFRAGKPILRELVPAVGH